MPRGPLQLSHMGIHLHLYLISLPLLLLSLLSYLGLESSPKMLT